MQVSDNSKRILLLSLVCAAYLVGAGALSFVGPDEPRYAQVAREMFERGDLVTPTLGGETWFEKPALLYWLMIGAYATFGAVEWAARLPSALAGLATVGAVVWTCRRVEAFDETARRASSLAFVCGAAAASSLGLLVFARAASFDCLVTAATAWTLAFFFAAEVERNEAARGRLLMSMYVCAGVGLLAKGLVGVVVPGVVVASYYLLRGRFPGRRMLSSVAWGVPVALLIAAVWYAPVIWTHGRGFVDEFFIQHHFARYTTNKYKHPQGFYFYFLILPLLALPWTPALGAAVAEARSWAWRGESAGDRLRVFALAWTLAPLLFFSASGSKLPGYVLPALPGAALLAGEWLARRMMTEEDDGGAARVLRVIGIMLVMLACAGATAAAYLGEASLFVSSLVALPLALGSVMAWRTADRGSRSNDAVMWIAAGTLASVLCAAVFATGAAGVRHSTRELLARAGERGYGNELVYGLYMFDRTAEFYHAGRVAYDAAGEPLVFDSAHKITELVARQGSGAAVLVMTFPDAVSHLSGDARMDAEVVAANDGVALVRVRAR